MYTIQKLKMPDIGPEPLFMFKRLDGKYNLFSQSGIFYGIFVCSEKEDMHFYDTEGLFQKTYPKELFLSMLQ